MQFMVLFRRQKVYIIEMSIGYKNVNKNLVRKKSSTKKV